MTRIFIDGQGVCLDAARPFRVGLDVARATGLEEQGRQVRVSVPVTAESRAVMGDTCGVRAVERFNEKEHEVRVEAEGCVLLRGQGVMCGLEQDGDGRSWYNIEVREVQPGWVREAAENRLSGLAVDCSFPFTAAAIRDSWTWDAPVRMLPVQREEAIAESGGENLGMPARELGATDYHPFLHLDTLVRGVIAGAGYAVRSQFMEGELFRSLYISGRYPRRDVTSQKSGMDFCAMRTADRSAVGNRNGKVKADPYSTLNSLGNLVDTADPLLAAGAFNTNGVFQMPDARVAFVPRSEVQVGFRYHIHYRTPYSILSRTELAGFNGVSLPDNITRTFVIRNEFVDQRGQVYGGYNYKAFIFDYLATDSYQIVYKRVTNPNADLNNLQPGDTQTVTSAAFSTRSYSITMQSGYPIVGVELRCKPSGGSVYAASAKDWALYEGWVTETGTTEVTVDLVSAPVTVTPSSPQYFDTIFFEGAWEGATLTLLRDTSVTPVFSEAPAEGTTLHFADVVPTEVRQIDLLDAVRQMFDLRFQTDPLTKEVCIEPYGNFFGGQAVDWTSRSPSSLELLVAEPGEGMSRRQTLRYGEADEALAAWNEAHGEVLGQWTLTLAGRLAARSEKVQANPLFHPSLSLQGYGDAPAAWLMQVGERTDADASLNFPMKIVRYLGMATLPSGQAWGWPWYRNSYPLAGFHIPQQATLCFEDRDGCEGLHRFYDGSLRGLEQGRRVTLRLRLRPADIEALTLAGGPLGDLRSVFLVAVGGERVACRLESVGGYDPAAGGNCKCTFLTI